MTHEQTSAFQPLMGDEAVQKIIDRHLSVVEENAANWLSGATAPKDGTHFLGLGNGMQAIVYYGHLGNLFLSNTVEVFQIDWKLDYWKPLDNPPPTLHDHQLKESTEASNGK